MRLAMLVGDGKVLIGPSPASEVETKFKDALRSGGEGYARLEIWTEDRGVARYHKFPVQAAPKKKKA